MRVLMVLGRAAGGVGAHVDALVTQLRRLGHDVEVVTADSTARTFGWTDAHRLWPVHGGVRAPRGLVDWHRIMRLAGTVDVVHAHGHQAAVVAAVAVARARPRPRLLVSLHNDLPPSRTSVAARGVAVASRLVLGWALRQADLVTGASADLVELARDLGARRTEVALVPSTAVPGLLRSAPSSPEERASLLEPLGIAPEGPLVLTVSRIAPQKDLGTLVRAAGLSRGGATWVVVGGGDESLRRSLAHESADPGSGAGRVHLVGPRADVSTWVRSADVFVLTSRWEARALVVQEAMAAGLPVVVTRTGGLPDLVEHAGSLVPVGDPRAVADEVDRLLADPAERRRLGDAARAVAASWPSAEDEARRWVDRYATDARGMT